MLTCDQYLEMADKFRNQGNLPMAVQMYNEVLRLEPKNGLVHANVAKIMNSQSNFQGEYEALKQFMNCYLTPVTIDIVSGAKQRLGDLEKQFGAPQPIK